MEFWLTILIVSFLLFLAIFFFYCRLAEKKLKPPLVYTLAGGRPSPPVLRGKVTYIVDGDTIVINYGEERIRLIGIDTPERGQPGYWEAKSFLRKHTLDKNVLLELAPNKRLRDRYNRLLAYVIVDGEDIGLRLLKEGLAISRYDSRDGYGRHPHELEYIEAEKQRTSS